ncbi:hypothetical protein [Arthrobacter sp. KK5.5]|uniref:hypothetical protein n=1 Tax=Arthrobacter sp. KK5.5 TaxID=3373084 RepID=UPI003EE6CFF4
MEPDARRRPSLGRVGAVVLLLAAAGIAGGGILLIQAAAAVPAAATFGWFAYAPLSAMTESAPEGLVVLTQGQAVGVLLLGLGLSGLAFLAGLRFGRGPRQPEFRR